MKKTILSVLLVLLLSIAFLGCPTGPCDVCGEEPCICKAASDSALNEKALGILTSMGLSSNDLPTPLGTTFLACEGNTGTIIVFWKDANKAMYDAYHAAWQARALTVSEYSAFITAQIEFYPEAGTGLAGAYPAGSISFTGTGKK